MPCDENPCFMQQGLKAARLSDPGGHPLLGRLLPAQSKRSYDILFVEKNTLTICCIIDGLPGAWPAVRVPLIASSVRSLAGCWVLFSGRSPGTRVPHPQQLAGPAKACVALV